MIKPVLCECYSIRNVDADCQQRLLGFQSKELQLRNHEVLVSLLQSPDKEFPLAMLYIQQQKGTLISDGKHLYRFDGSRWLQMHDHKATRDMQHWLESTLTALINPWWRSNIGGCTHADPLHTDLLLGMLLSV